MNYKMLKKLLSAITAFSFLFTTATGPASAALTNEPAMPEFVKELTPPTQLGYVDSYYKGNTEKPVILIQDLHANYGVQKKISHLLEFYQPKVSLGGQPMVVGMEAAWGKMDISFLRAHSLKVRKAAAEAMLREAQISGMENYAMINPENVKFVGIDDKRDYQMHKALFKKSLATRVTLAYKADQLRDSLSASKKNASPAMKRLWKLERSFQEGRIGLPELAKALDLPSLNNYGDAEKALYQKKMELGEKASGDKGRFLSNIAKADQHLALLARLFRQQLTQEEVRFAAKNLPEILSVVQTLMPKENMSQWNDAINAAIDHYTMALLRDQPLSKNTEQMAKDYSNQSVIAVTGGFHTAGIAADLKKANRTYIVVAPIVESHTYADEIIYMQRMTDQKINLPRIVATARSLMGNTTVKPTGAVTNEAMGEDNTATEVIAQVENGQDLDKNLALKLKTYDNLPKPEGSDLNFTLATVDGNAQVTANTPSATSNRIAEALTNGTYLGLGMIDAALANQNRQAQITFEVGRETPEVKNGNIYLPYGLAQLILADEANLPNQLTTEDVANITGQVMMKEGVINLTPAFENMDEIGLLATHIEATASAPERIRNGAVQALEKLKEDGAPLLTEIKAVVSEGKSVARAANDLVVNANQQLGMFQNARIAFKAANAVISVAKSAEQKAVAATAETQATVANQQVATATMLPTEETIKNANAIMTGQGSFWQRVTWTFQVTKEEKGKMAALKAGFFA